MILRLIITILCFAASSMVFAGEKSMFYVVEIANQLSKIEALNLAAKVEEKTHLGTIFNLKDSKYDIRPYPEVRGIGVQVVRDMNITPLAKNYQVIAYMGDSKENAAFLIEQKLSQEFPKARVKAVEIKFISEFIWSDVFKPEFYVLILGSFKTKERAISALLELGKKLKVPTYQNGWVYHHHDDCENFCLGINHSKDFKGYSGDFWVITGPAIDQIDSDFKEKLKRARVYVEDAFYEPSYLFYGSLDK